RRHGSLAIALVTRNGLERLKMARCRELIDIDPSGGLEGALQSFRWAEKQQVRQVRWLIAGPRRRTERQRPDKRQDLLTFCGRSGDRGNIGWKHFRRNQRRR